jgi:predicted deacylase
LVGLALQGRPGWSGEIAMQDFDVAFSAAACGTRFRGRIPLGTMPSGAGIGIPFVGLRGGGGDGPCLWINGQVHGDEINGILAGFEFINGLDAASIAGSVVLTTTANPLALDWRRKKTPLDEEDLDQSFPGRADGFVSERMAAALFPVVAAHATVTVCMHAVGTPYDALPYAVYKLHPSGAVAEERLLRLAAHFRPAAACRMAVSPGAGELPGNVAGALDYQLLAAGRTALMLELGGGGRAEPEFIAQAAAGLRGIAATLGIVPGAGQPEAPRTLRRVTRRGHVTCDAGGFARTAVRPGAVVPAGSPLLHIWDAYGDLAQTVTLPRDAVVISIRRDPVVHSGDRVAFLGLEWDDVAIG